MNLKPGIKLLSERDGTGIPASRDDVVKIGLKGWLNRGDIIQENHVQELTLVGHAANSVTLRAAVPVRVKARFAGNGSSLSKKRNAESCRHSGSRRAAAQALWAAFRSLELAMASPALARHAHNACATAERYRISRMAH